MMCHYKNLGRLCFLVGLIVGLSSLLVAHSDIQRTLGFLLGMIGYGLFSGLSLYVEQIKNSSPKSPN
uniref:Uncharacterized protein n=2 Tax=Enterobacteriaceae TaxID=543 RepID=A0A2R4KLD2_ECOLX|nr:hypothetical protein pCf587_0043 [Citrobacter freundii]AVV60443.1 Hypothetical protein [Escherichia coli]